MKNDQFLKQMGAKIKKARQQRGMSLQRLSQLCMADYSNLLAIERGRKNARILTVVMIAETLGIEAKELI